MNWQNPSYPRPTVLLPIEERTKNRAVCGELGEGSGPPPLVEGVEMWESRGLLGREVNGITEWTEADGAQPNASDL